MKNSAPITLVILCFIGFAVPARAEALDDASIRAFYAEYIEALKRPDNYQSFVQKRFDDKYTLQENLNRTINDGPPRTSSDTIGKDQAILNSIRQSGQTHLTSVAGNILSIQYSADHRFAFVTHTVVSSGLTKLPDANGSLSDATYEDAEACADQLALKNDLLQIVKSACNGKLVLSN